MEKMIAIEFSVGRERIDERKRWLRPVYHRNSHGAVQRHDWRGLYLLKKIVEPENLMPIRVFGTCSLTMERRDRSLHRKRAGSATKGLLNEWKRLGDLLLVPEAAILLFENYQDRPPRRSAHRAVNREAA